MIKKRRVKKSSGKAKKTNKKTSNGYSQLKQKLTLGQKIADKVTTFGGSWTFIISFLSFLIIWIIVNGWVLTRKPFDPFPFILLNLFLSCLAAVQAPIILMSQNRQAERDRINAKYDYQVNRKAERAIEIIIKNLNFVKRKIINLIKEKEK